MSYAGMSDAEVNEAVAIAKGWKREGGAWLDPEGRRAILPDFAGQIADAWLLVEEMNNMEGIDGYKMEFINGVHLFGMKRKDRTYLFDFSGDASPARAICLCFLSVLEQRAKGSK